MEKKPPVVDKRIIRLEDVMKKDYIPFLGGRPDREKVIRLDDVLDVKINLNLTDTVEDFIKIM
jgi:hypothetical protein